MWAGALSFDAAVGEHRRGVQQSCEPLNAILPLRVELTDGAAHHASRALNHKTQKVRIPKKCIDSLRTYCITKCPDLLRTPAEAIAAAESGASSSAPNTFSSAPNTTSSAGSGTSSRKRKLTG
eukprot:4431975-Pleurochrysis_carterae.AAC.1